MFSTWYRLVAPEPRAETLSSRWAAVEATAKSTNGDALLETLRVALGKPTRNSEFVAQLRAKLQKGDPTIPAAENELEISVLAGAIWANTLLRADPGSDLAALAMTAIQFRGDLGQSLSSVFAVRGAEYLTSQGAERRDPERAWTTPRIPDLKLEEAAQAFQQALAQNQAPSASSHFPPVVERLNTSAQKINAALKALSDQVSTVLTEQREQSDIAWWLLGQYSRELGDFYSHQNLAKCCLVVGKELADLTVGLIPPIAAEAVLGRMLQLPKGDNATIYDAITCLEATKRSSWVGDDHIDRIQDFAPLHFSLVRSLESSGHQDWKGVLRTAMGLDADALQSAKRIAHQFYLERLLLRAAKNVSR